MNSVAKRVEAFFEPCVIICKKQDWWMPDGPKDRRLLMQCGVNIIQYQEDHDALLRRLSEHGVSLCVMKDDKNDHA